MLGRSYDGHRMVVTENQYLPFGQIIVLNGASSSGKSTLAQGLIKALTIPHLHLQLDMFRSMEPAGYWEVDGDMMWRRVAALCRAINASVASYSRHGQAVIVDHVLSDEAWHYLLEDLIDLPVLLIKVSCSLDELSAREKVRSDRKSGLAKSQHISIHANREYDFVVDTSRLNPDECAAAVLDWLQSKPVSVAFKEMQYRAQRA